MIDFIFGDAGSGKSEYIYTWISREAQNAPYKQFYLFVPEQNTLKAQQEIIAKSPCHGMLNLEVLSFQLLAYRVMEELGLEKPVLIDEVSKSILLRKAVSACADRLKIYKSKVNSPGFITQMKTLISELCQYDADPEELRKAGESSRLPLLSGKLSDISEIWTQFRKLIGEKSAIPEELAVFLLSCISRSKLMDGAVLVFDGYTGFTPLQLQVLEHLISRAERCRFSVTIPRSADPYRAGVAGDDITDIFWLSRETVAAVCRAAERNNVRRGDDTEIRRQRKPAQVRIIQAEDPAQEARLLARDIRRRALLDGVRYRRIAIAVSDPSVYGTLLRQELDRESVPYFTDERSDAVGSPAAELVRSALGALAGGYRADDVMAFVRNPLLSRSPEEREEADILENYLRRTALRGRRALAGLRTAFGLEDIFRLEDDMKQAGTVAQMTEAVRAFCLRKGLSERAEAYADRIESMGFLRQAEECRRFARMIPDFLTRMEVLLGDESCTIEEFRALTEAGFRDMKGGMIPERMDTVVIGDLRRSRFGGIDYLYVMGAYEGALPSAVTGGGILTDPERSELIRKGISLAPDDRTDSCIQLFYLRLLFHKPALLLTISFPQEGRDGRALRESRVLSEIRKGEFGEFEAPERIVQDASALISSPGDAMLSLAGYASRKSTKEAGFTQLYQALCRAGRREEADRLLGAAFAGHKPERLSREAALALYGTGLEGSVTRIENYEGCPFYQFVRHGLGLKERQMHELASLDIGNLYHGALDSIFKDLKAEGKSLTETTDEKLKELCEKAVGHMAEAYQGALFRSSARNQYIASKVLRTALRTAGALREQMAEGNFSAEETELHFRHREGRLILQGTIDRLDLCRREGKTYLSVIDYKSGRKDFTLDHALNGLELQLAIYMDHALRRQETLETGAEMVPAGMFYYQIDDPVIRYERGMTQEELARLRRKALRLQGALTSDTGAAALMDRSLQKEDGPEGLVTGKDLKNSPVLSAGTQILSGEEFRALLGRVRQRVRRDTERILAGDIAVRPAQDGRWKKCEYCAYHSICRFDESMEGYRYRHV